MSRALLRSVLELRTPITRLPPTFLLPIRTARGAVGARSLHQTSQIVDPASQQRNAVEDALLQSSSSSQKPQSSSSPLAASAASNISSTTPQQHPPSPPTTPIDPSVKALLPFLAAQPNHYLTIHIHGKPYLVTEGDSVRLPFKMPGVVPGDVLRLNRASVVGSRDYTLQGAPYVDERLFECRAVVTGTEAEPMRILIKKKRRCRRKKTVQSKHRFTMLRISEVKIVPDVDELD